MADENMNAGSANAGSQGTDPNVFDTSGQSDEGQKNNDNVVPKEQYDALETKLGEQGNELGEYRKFFADVNPLLEKLDSNPELVKAILDDKIDVSLIDAASKGKITTKEAENITEAHKEVKKELGKETYAKTSPDEIVRLTEEKMEALKASIETMKDDFSKKLNDKIAEVEMKREFEAKVNEFISATSDFPEYAVAIDKYIDDHPEVKDLEMAYHIVKGIALQQKIKEDEDKRIAEEGKNAAANAGGGSSMATGIDPKADPFEALVGKSTNPNAF